MVMNIGQNPTVNKADAETTVEIHILHKFSKDFYGQPMQAIASGFIRYTTSGLTCMQATVVQKIVFKPACASYMQ